MSLHITAMSLYLVNMSLYIIKMFRACTANALYMMGMSRYNAAMSAGKENNVLYMLARPSNKINMYRACMHMYRYIAALIMPKRTYIDEFDKQFDKVGQQFRSPLIYRKR